MSQIDDLIYQAVFAKEDEERISARKQIRQMATDMGIHSSSIHNFYMAIGHGKTNQSFTVPAINIRAMTYDTARIVFQLISEKHIGPVVFEIARSEIEYTDQRPDEYAVSVLAAAIKENYKGPVFLQGDHFQLSANRYKEDKEQEKNKIKTLVDEALNAGFKNIDIDASTLVDLSKPKEIDQQWDNYVVTAEMTSYIRSRQQKGEHVSIGGEIGHIGGKNSTVLDLQAFMEGYQGRIDGLPGISKISVQTGTSHGGIPREDGSIEDVDLDFSVLRDIGSAARDVYHIGGVVQHGASTLPNDLFHNFPANKTLEIHLATGFQNIVYDNMPSKLRDRMYAWVEQNCKKDQEEGWSKEQFVYKCRKKAIGPFKLDMWNLSEQDKEPIRKALKEQFAFLFEQLGMFNTREILIKHV